MLPVVVVCAGVCSILLLAWIVLDLSWHRRRPAVVDRVCGACFAALGVTSVVTLRCLVVEPGSRGPLPVFVFFGAPIGFYLAWLSWRLARERGA